MCDKLAQVGSEQGSKRQVAALDSAEPEMNHRKRIRQMIDLVSRPIRPDIRSRPRPRTAMKPRAASQNLSELSAQYAFTAYQITNQVQDGSSIRIRTQIATSSSSPLCDQGIDLQDTDLVDVSVFRGSGNGLAFVGQTRGSIQIDPDDPNPYRLLVIAIRGTERTSVKNWITNLSVLRSSICSGSSEMVHSGFLSHWKSLVNAGLLRHVISRVQSGSKKILLTGHSLGGSVAFLSAYQLSELISPSIETLVYAFGAPRIGNEEFERNYAARVPSTFSQGHPLDPVCIIGTSAYTEWMEHARTESMNPSTMLSVLCNGAMFLSAGPLSAVRGSSLAIRSVAPVIRYVRLFLSGACIGVAVRAFYLGIKFHGGYCPDFITEIIPPFVVPGTSSEVLDPETEDLLLTMS